jgi:hypothetical protein
MRKVLVTIGLVVGLTGGAAYGSGRNHADTYQAWRTSPNAPLSVTFRGRCLEAEDSAAHLRLISYDRGHVVYGCKRRGF